ncbi:hypothetical protein C0995_003534 [Termitomyces sp. Mi166|nr:hypothetical protein C0995_003534 [Termitomyces sp. Mi166\
MSSAGFDTTTRAHVPVAQPLSLYDPCRHEGQDERDSVSGSDDGNYIHDSAKGDFDPDDYTALTSQTLNTDGTPKRPMNAFMIFARKRRPQVSAENQAMRTGEISKILSKEWNNMETASKIFRSRPAHSQKQFYQEQARLLKDNFNSKYPDYVYRRRPNNTRRKRKPDAPGQRPPDTHPSFSEDVGFDDTGDSPTDDSYSSEVMSDIHRARLGHEMYPNDHSKSRHGNIRASSYPYPSFDSRSSSGHENHTMYDTVVSGDHVLQDGSLEQSTHFSYVSAQPHGRAQTQSMLVFPQNFLNNDGNWTPSSNPSSSWLGPEPQSRNFSLSALKTHRSAHSSEDVLSPSPLPLPTLSSPFFPDDSSQQLSPPALMNSISPSSYNPSHIPSPILVGREFGQHDVSLSSGVPNTGQPYNVERNINGLMYAPGPQRQSGGPRGLPLISDYPQLQTQPSFSPHLSLGNQQEYWPKD